jgi:hypothetical protein
MKTRLALLALLVAVQFWSHVAQAQEQPPSPTSLPSRTARYAWDTIGDPPNQKPILRASFSYTDAINDPAITKKLGEGLTNIIVMRAYVFREGESSPIALAVKTCRVRWDEWDEVYRVKVTEPDKDRDQPLANMAGVMRTCAQAQDLAVVNRSLLQAGKPHFLAVIVEVNPVSPEMLEQLKRWVSRPTGSTGIGPTDGLFGSFAGVFIRKLATSDKTLSFRTQAVSP